MSKTRPMPDAYHTVRTDTLSEQAGELCLAIEQLPPSEQQTDLSVLAHNLLQRIYKLEKAIVKGAR